MQDIGSCFVEVSWEIQSLCIVLGADMFFDLACSSAIRDAVNHPLTSRLLSGNRCSTV